MQEFTAKSINLVMKSLSQIVERHRVATGKSIYAISAECGLSKSTWREVEIGACNNITLTTLMKIADGLEIPLYVIIEELYKELGEDFTLIDE